MNKEDRLYKLFQGADTAVWAHDEIVNQDKRIAELEEERAVRDLEQQAKGLEDYVSKTMDNSYILHLDPEDIHHCILINLNATALRLLERAKALKEQE